MTEISRQLFSVAVESIYKRPALFQESRWAEVAPNALDAFASNGLRPGQIALKKGDELYNYEISFALFNGNGTFRLSSERLEITFQNAISAADQELIIDCVAKCHDRIPLPEIALTRISVYLHAALESIEAKNKFLAKFANPEKNVISGGLIAYVLSDKWKTEFRVTLDRSLVYPAAIFISWETQFLGSRLTRDQMMTFGEACEDVAQKLDLVFKKR